MNAENERDVVERLWVAIDEARHMHLVHADPSLMMLKLFDIQNDMQALRTALAASAAQPGVSGGEALDAARWRFWRDSTDQQFHAIHSQLFGQNADNAIDRAMQRATPPAETGSGATPLLWHSVRALLDVLEFRANRDGGEHDAEIGPLIEMVEAAMQHSATPKAASGQAVAQEPVFWCDGDDFGNKSLGSTRVHRDKRVGSYLTVPLFDHPAPSAASVRAEDRNAVLEEAAQACECLGKNYTRNNWRLLAEANTAKACAQNIRALQTPRASREGRAHG